MAVVFPAVQLDDQLGGGPEDVDLVAEDVDVGLAGWDAVCIAEALEAILERGAGPRCGAGFGEEPTDRLQGVAAVAPLADELDSSQLQQLEPIRFLPGPLEPSKVHHFGEVKERAGDGSDRNAILLRSFIVTVKAAAVKADARPPPAALVAAGRGDVYWATAPHQPPKRGGVRVAQNSSFAAGEDGTEPASALTDQSVADCVGAAIDLVKASYGQPPLDRTIPDPDRRELPLRHHPVLTRRKCRKRPLPPSTPGVSDFLRHMWR